MADDSSKNIASAVTANMADVRADLYKMDTGIKTWTIATVTSLLLGFAGLSFAMNSSLRSASATPTAAAPPVIITLPQAAAPPPAPAAK